MNIIFDKKASILRDMLSSIGTICNYERFLELLERDGIELDKDIEKALSELKDAVNPKDEAVQIFFGYDSEVAYALIDDRELYGKSSMEDCFKELNTLEEEKINQRLVQYIKNENIEYLKEEKLDCKEGMLKFIKSLDISSASKWRLFEFIGEPKRYINELIKIIEDYIPKYNKVYKKYEKLFEKHSRHIQREVEEEGMNFLNKITKNSLRLEEFKEIVIMPSYLNPYMLQYNLIEDKGYLHIGIFFEELQEKMFGKNDLEEKLTIFKNLSDATKFNIVKLLVERDYYGQELAEKLGVRAATISYHMGILLLSKMVHIERKDHRAYYSLNKDTLKDSIKFLEKEFNL